MFLIKERRKEKYHTFIFPFPFLYFSPEMATPFLPPPAASGFKKYDEVAGVPYSSREGEGEKFLGVFNAPDGFCLRGEGCQPTSPARSSAPIYSEIGNDSGGGGGGGGVPTTEGRERRRKETLLIEEQHRQDGMGRGGSQLASDGAQPIFNSSSFKASTQTTFEANNITSFLSRLTFCVLRCFVVVGVPLGLSMYLGWRLLPPDPLVARD